MEEIAEDLFGMLRNDPPTIGAVEQVQAIQPPVVSAGANRTVTLPLDRVVISGTRDPDGRFTAFLWEKVSGPSVTRLIRLILFFLI